MYTAFPKYSSPLPRQSLYPFKTTQHQACPASSAIPSPSSHSLTSLTPHPSSLLPSSPLLAPHLSSIPARGGGVPDVRPHPSALSQPSHTPDHPVGPVTPAPPGGHEAQPVRGPAAAGAPLLLLLLLLPHLPAAAAKPNRHPRHHPLAHSQETAGHPAGRRQRQLPLRHTHHSRPASAGDDEPIATS